MRATYFYEITFAIDNSVSPSYKIDKDYVPYLHKYKDMTYDLDILYIFSE